VPAPVRFLTTRDGTGTERSRFLSIWRRSGSVASTCSSPVGTELHRLLNEFADHTARSSGSPARLLNRAGAGFPP
jgi:hypothetical protein